MQGGSNKPTWTSPYRSRLGRRIDRACEISYELALLAVLFLVAIVPLHRAATERLNVVRRVDNSHVLVRAPASGPPAVGTVLPVYRYSTRIGTIRVEEVRGDALVASFDVKAFRQPMGRHGQILSGDAGGVTLNIGTNASLRRNDKLTVFAQRKRVGSVVVTDVGPESARGQAALAPGVDPMGLAVSEFQIATQVVVDPGALITFLEYGGLAGLLGAYGWYWFARRRSPFLATGEWLRGFVARSGLRHGRIAVQLLLGIPFVWFAAGFLPSLVSVVVTKLVAHLRAIFPSWQDVYLWPWFLQRLPVLYAIGGAAYVAYLLYYWRSPILAVWKRLGWRPWLYAWLPPGPRRAMLWALQLIIAYAFASTVLVFLQVNLSTMLQLGWRGTPPQMHGAVNLLDPAAALTWFGGLLRTVTYMLTHAPVIMSVESGLEIAKNLLWSLTVVGVLVGYVHSTVGPLWGAHIRNLDFTVVGWVTNAFCYPLLGTAIWQLVPAFKGEDPLLTGGLPYALMLALGLLFNLLYTITIWNLGTKFGVMTDKGVRTTGFYAVVRHPSYTLEAIAFVVLGMNALSGIKEWWGISMYLVMYWLRSERDDVFMSAANPDYLRYRERTPYKFIPGIY